MAIEGMTNQTVGELEPVEDTGQKEAPCRSGPAEPTMPAPPVSSLRVLRGHAKAWK